uniref:Putative secreted peptide n=1 Tax=Anopheles braziliensis TaxID=58242 RepID=A0A2M3ZWC4_9DIPT
MWYAKSTPSVALSMFAPATAAAAAWLDQTAEGMGEFMLPGLAYGCARARVFVAIVFFPFPLTCSPFRMSKRNAGA